MLGMVEKLKVSDGGKRGNVRSIAQAPSKRAQQRPAVGGRDNRELLSNF